MPARRFFAFTDGRKSAKAAGRTLLRVLLGRLLSDIVAAASAPVAVISVTDVTALRALERPLPHYGAQSWLVLEGSRMIEKGVWAGAGKVVVVK